MQIPVFAKNFILAGLAFVLAAVSEIQQVKLLLYYKCCEGNRTTVLDCFPISHTALKYQEDFLKTMQFYREYCILFIRFLTLPSQNGLRVWYGSKTAHC